MLINEYVLKKSTPCVNLLNYVKQEFQYCIKPRLFDN